MSQLTDDYINQKEAYYLYDLSREDLISELGEGIHDVTPTLGPQVGGWDGEVRQKLYLRSEVVKVLAKKKKQGGRLDKKTTALREFVRKSKELFRRRFKQDPDKVKHFFDGTFVFVSLYQKCDTSKMGLYSLNMDGTVSDLPVHDNYAEHILGVTKSGETTNFFLEDIL